jgi:phenylacetate-CoA ligase
MIYEPYIECAPVERLRLVQASRLRPFLSDVVPHIPVYRERISEAGGHQGLQACGDEEFLARYCSAVFTGPKEYVAADAHALNALDKQLYFLETTSGSTAAPKSRYATREDDLIDQRMLARSFAAFGITSSQRILTVDLGDLNMYALMTKGLAELGAFNSLFYCARRDFARSMKEALTSLPDVLITVPSLLTRSLVGLLDGLRVAGSVKKLIYYAEPLDGRIQRRLREEFRIESFSLYSSVECGIIGAECEAHDGIHVWADCVLPALKDASPVKKGSFKNRGEEVLQGSLALTTMMHRGKPTLAYLTGDEVQYTDAPCACGRTMPRINFIQRKTDVFSVFGTKYTYQQIYDIVYQDEPLASFLQVILEDGDGGTVMTLILPAQDRRGVKERQGRIYTALKSHPSLSLMMGHGVLDFQLEFVPDAFFTGRKIRKVEDRRGKFEQTATT